MARLISVLVATIVALALVTPMALADPATGTTDTLKTAALASRISVADPLNGGFLLVNMHGMLFHPALSDIDEDVAYARWLGSGVIRVFATDNNGFAQLGRHARRQRASPRSRPMLRAAHIALDRRAGQQPPRRAWRAAGQLRLDGQLLAAAAALLHDQLARRVLLSSCAT